MTEKVFQTLWHKYLVTNPPTDPEAHELKLTKKNTFVFDSVKEHQIQGLLMAQEGLFHKISDSPVSWSMNQTRFSVPKPFDCMWLTGLTSYVVICFYVPRKYKKVFKISIEDFLEFKKGHPRKSIRLEELEKLTAPMLL
jgi:penicillin-binding protein-related factor A (putative recombinase)